MSGMDEFGLIDRLFRPLTFGRPEALDLRDDVALIEGRSGVDWAITMDGIVEGVHFFANDPPQDIARKLLRVNLSDLAAKSAVPRFVLLTACFPSDVTIEWLDHFAAGLKSDCAEYGVALIGGDTLASAGPLMLSLVALGEVPKRGALLRSNARSGDMVWVSGTLGDAAFGLEVARGRETSPLSSDERAYLLERYRIPQPRLGLGQALRGIAHGAIDISDGLIADFGHLCRASGLRGVIDFAALPRSKAVETAITAGLSPGLSGLVSGGDDYEILFTAPPEALAALSALAQTLSLSLTRIGRVEAGEGVVILSEGGQEMSFDAAGYTHFSEVPA